MKTLQDLTNEWKVLKAQHGLILPNIDKSRYSEEVYNYNNATDNSRPQTMITRRYSVNDDPYNDIVIIDNSGYSSGKNKYRKYKYQGQTYVDPTSESNWVGEKSTKEMPQELRNYLQALGNHIRGIYSPIQPVTWHE